MPSNVSYPRKYYSTTYAELDTIPLKEGNVIALSDTDGFYYDIGNPAGSGQNVTRRQASNIEYVASLLDARHEPTTIFIVQDSTMVDEDGNTVMCYSGYRWNEDVSPAKFDEVFNNLRDFKVKSIPSANTRAYLVGSIDNAETIGSLVKNPNIYLTSNGNKIHANLEGNADTSTEANHTALADIATSAINDNAPTPKPITGYLNDVVSDAVSGTTITFTKGDGTTTSIKAANTTYDIYTANAPGLVNGTNTQVLSDTSGLLLSGDGWIDTDNIVIPVAESATKDGEGQVIASTYVKSASYDINDQELTLTFGDDTTSSPISIPDTQYDVFDFNDPGLVPGPTLNDSDKYLKGDGTWDVISVPTYVGATALDDGVDGLVPHAQAGEQSYYLKGDGTWGTTFTADTDGLVPGPSIADAGKSLKVDQYGNGVWEACTDTQNTTGTSNDIVNSLYLVGASVQTTSCVTNTNQYVFIQGNKLYQSDGGVTPTAVQVVDVSSTQALTNKTYEGYTLGSACEKTAASSVIPDTNLPTNNAVISYTNNRITQVRNLIGGKLDSTAAAPTYNELIQDGFVGDGATTTFTLTESCSGISEVTVAGEPVSSGYSYDSGTNSIAFTTAPADTVNIVVSYTMPYAVDDWCVYDGDDGMRLYRCITAITTAEPFDDTKWVEYTLIEAIKYLIANP